MIFDARPPRITASVRTQVRRFADPSILHPGLWRGNLGVVAAHHDGSAVTYDFAVVKTKWTRRLPIRLHALWAFWTLTRHFYQAVGPTDIQVQVEW